MSFEERPEDLEKNVASLGFDSAGEWSGGSRSRSITSTSSATRLRRAATTTSKGCSCASGTRLIGGCQTRRAEHHRVALCRAVESSGAAGRDSASVSVAEGPRHHRDDHRRTGRGNPDARQGLEEYVSDCVILLDHRVVNQVSTRRIRVVEYRGSTHGTNEYPFLIDEDGISVLPITSLSLAHTASQERVSTGIPALDEMLGGKGCFRGNTSCCRAPRARGRRRFRHPSPMPHAAAANERCISPSRNRRRRSSATCVRWAWISSAGPGTGCCGSWRHGPRSTASRCTSPRCTR